MALHGFVIFRIFYATVFFTILTKVIAATTDSAQILVIKIVLFYSVLRTGKEPSHAVLLNCDIRDNARPNLQGSAMLLPTLSKPWRLPPYTLNHTICRLIQIIGLSQAATRSRPR